MYLCVRREWSCICVLDVSGHVFVSYAFILFLSPPLLFSVLSVVWQHCIFSYIFLSIFYIMTFLYYECDFLTR